MGGATLDELKRLRGLIDEVDRDIIKLLEKRMDLCRRIGRVKKELDFPLEDPVREDELLRERGVWKDVFRVIVDLCKKEQASLLENR